MLAFLWGIIDICSQKQEPLILAPLNNPFYRLNRYKLNRLNQRPPIPQDVRREVFRNAGYKCVYCQSSYLLEVDHIYPRSRGGADHISNYQCLCQACNRHKSDKIPSFV